jgi:putative tryptophan/tyrosine transport system substrate-binding protein
MPWVHTIGVLYDPAGNSLFIQEVISRAKMIGLRVVGIPVDGKDAIQSGLEKNWYQMDALWLIPDKTVISSADMVPYLINEALLRKVPVIGYNSYFFRSGAALSFYFDRERIGCQTAEIVMDRLGKNLCRNEAPEYEILVNDSTFKQIDALSAVAAQEPVLK